MFWKKEGGRAYTSLQFLIQNNNQQLQIRNMIYS
nr:MAG TPA: hypothetical protein [Caudoviricetes sp.]